jgi:hypothetical protein
MDDIMGKAIIATFLVISLTACANAPGGPGGSQHSSAQANQSTVGGSVYSTIGPGAPGGRAGDIDQTTSIDARIALDPSAFANIFGNTSSPSVTPNASQLGQIADYGRTNNNVELQQKAVDCLNGRTNCVVQRQ